MESVKYHMLMIVISHQKVPLPYNKVPAPHGEVPPPHDGKCDVPHAVSFDTNPPP
jgi:hypothetical protein